MLLCEGNSKAISELKQLLAEVEAKALAQTRSLATQKFTTSVGKQDSSLRVADMIESGTSEELKEIMRRINSIKESLISTYHGLSNK